MIVSSIADKLSHQLNVGWGDFLWVGHDFGNMDWHYHLLNNQSHIHIWKLLCQIAFTQTLSQKQYLDFYQSSQVIDVLKMKLCTVFISAGLVAFL